jgi:hypothetical protein
MFSLAKQVPLLSICALALTSPAAHGQRVRIAPRVGGALRFNARPHWGCFGFCNGPLGPHPHG